MIRKIQIRNFKSIAEVSVELDPLTVLVGRSGSGKTNFIDALRFWRDHINSRAWVGDQEFWPSRLGASTGDRKFGIDVAFSVPNTKEEFRYLLTYEFPKAGVVPGLAREVFRVGDRIVFDQQGNQWRVKPSSADVPSPGQLSLGLWYSVPEDKQAYLTLTRGLGCYDFPGQVLQNARSNGQRIDVGLDDHAENYVQAFEAISEDLLNFGRTRQIVAALRTLNLTVTSIGLETRSRSRILVAHQVGDIAMALGLGQESEGFRRFLAHLIALFQVPARPVLAFEEPEKGIFPAVLATLADYFNAAKDKTQIILTTHSPQLLDHFPVEAIRVVTMRDYLTHIGNVSNDQREAVRQSLLTTGELLTVDPARIEEPEAPAEPIAQ